MGIHARPAGLLAKAVKTLDSILTISKADGKSAAGTKLTSLMGLGVKRPVTVTVETAGEEAGCAVMEQFFRDNL